MSTYAKFDGNGKEVAADLLSDSLATGNTREIDVAGLDETLLALDSTEDLVGKSGHVVSDYGPTASSELTDSRHKPWTRWRNRDRPWP